MVLSRNQVFIILCMLAAGPFLVNNGLWVANSGTAIGTVWFRGHTMQLQSISSHPVIRFSAVSNPQSAKDSILKKPFFRIPAEINKPVAQ
ncbi:MAG: hypothetical protein EOO00_05450 [Chitinophagaceae bacterium]|nr:MAG: hypothetical protein EOO00_05450 [Chitinophagaceae bacterium]